MDIILNHLSYFMFKSGYYIKPLKIETFIDNNSIIWLKLSNLNQYNLGCLFYINSYLFITSHNFVWSSINIDGRKEHIYQYHLKICIKFIICKVFLFLMINIYLNYKQTLRFKYPIFIYITNTIYIILILNIMYFV